MNITALRERVRAAHQQEEKEAGLRHWLEQRLPALHPAITPAADAGETLLAFVEAYISQVPDILEAAQAVADAANIRGQLLPVLKVAEAFFLQPPDLPADHQGLLALLDEAYLAHRLLEEVNDRYLVHGGEPLIPVDNTRANLIVHQLLGEPFANRLDAAVHEAVGGLVPESLFAGPAFRQYQDQLDPDARQRLWAQWDCLSERLGVGLTWREPA